MKGNWWCYCFWQHFISCCHESSCCFRFRIYRWSVALLIDVAFAILRLLVSVLLTRLLKKLANPIFVFIHNAITNITNFTLWKSICFNWIWTKACRMDDADKTIGLLAFAIYVVFYIFKWSHFGLCIDFMFDKTVVAISSSCLPTVYWLC